MAVRSVGTRLQRRGHAPLWPRGSLPSPAGSSSPTAQWAAAPGQGCARSQWVYVCACGGGGGETTLMGLFDKILL